MIKIIARCFINDVKKLKEFCINFDRIIFSVLDSPNYGMQAINLKPIRSLIEYLGAKNSDQKLVIATNEKELPSINQTLNYVAFIYEINENIITLHNTVSGAEIQQDEMAEALGRYLNSNEFAIFEDSILEKLELCHRVL